jgi:hypothetical protein
MGELRIYRAADDFDAALLEFFQSVIESDQFRRADKGEIQGIEEQHNVFAPVGGKLQFLDFIVTEDCVCGEIGSGFANQNGHGDLLR